MSTLIDAVSSDLPSDWEVVTLGQILSEVDTRLKDNGLETRDFPVLSLTRNFGLILQSQRFNKRVATEDVSKYKVVKRGEIVYNPFVIWEGAVHALRDFECGIVSPVYVVWKCDEKIAESFYIDDLLRTPLVVEQYNLLAAGAVNRRRTIKREDFLKIRIPFPSIAEQRNIIRVLSTIRTAIEEQTRLIALTRELKSAIMHKLFSEGRREEVQKITKIGTMPRSWDVVSLDELLTKTQYGLSVQGGATGKYGILRMTNQVEGKISTEKMQFVNITNDHFENYQLQRGDILFNRTNSLDLVGRTAIFDVEGDYVFASYLIRLKTDPLCQDSCRA